eukprot:PhM_4_TR7630/c2_g1_i1/m.2193
MSYSSRPTRDTSSAFAPESSTKPFFVASSNAEDCFRAFPSVAISSLRVEFSVTLLLSCSSISRQWLRYLFTAFSIVESFFSAASFAISSFDCAAVSSAMSVWFFSCKLWSCSFRSDVVAPACSTDCKAAMRPCFNRFGAGSFESSSLSFSSVHSKSGKREDAPQQVMAALCISRSRLWRFPSCSSRLAFLLSNSPISFCTAMTSRRFSEISFAAASMRARLVVVVVAMASCPAPVSSRSSSISCPRRRISSSFCCTSACSVSTSSSSCLNLVGLCVSRNAARVRSIFSTRRDSSAEAFWDSSQDL